MPLLPYRFSLDPSVPLTEAEMTLQLAMVARLALFAVLHVVLSLGVGTAVLALGVLLFDKMTPGLDELAEVRRGNVALAMGPWFVRLADTGPVSAGFWRVALALPFLAVLARLNRQPLGGGESDPTCTSGNNGDLIPQAVHRQPYTFWTRAR